MGLGVTYWSVDPRDWSQPGAPAIIDRVVKNTVPGSIILLHDLHRQTADATGDLLDRLGDRHYQFAAISRILGSPYGPYV
jgi:peptidoglycan-N-acetylglucosamine deacetylase